MKSPKNNGYHRDFQHGLNMTLSRGFHKTLSELYNNEGIPTTTSDQQIRSERTVLRYFEGFLPKSSKKENLKLHQKTHVEYLTNILNDLPNECIYPDAPWSLYWALHSLYVLDSMPGHETLCRVVRFLTKCQHRDGGFSSGPGELAHLGSTFAALNALSIIGTEDAYKAIDRSRMQMFLWRMKKVDGTFSICKGGEQDMRGVYYAITIAKLTNVYSKSLFFNTTDWIMSCRTYEDGFGNRPGAEARAEATFHAAASLSLLRAGGACERDGLLRWLAGRQRRLEGGFQDGTNALLDGCSSFWLGAVLAILRERASAEGDDLVLFNQDLLQEYVLLVCQDIQGGLTAIPGRQGDLPSTSYGLSGLSLSQHGLDQDPVVAGDPSNELNPVHPVHNIGPHHVYNAVHYFIRHPVPVQDF